MQSENAVIITFEIVAAPGGGGGAAAEDLRGHGRRHHQDGGRGCDGAAAGAAGEVRGHVESQPSFKISPKSLRYGLNVGEAASFDDNPFE